MILNMNKALVAGFEFLPLVGNMIKYMIDEMVVVVVMVLCFVIQNYF